MKNLRSIFLMLLVVAMMASPSQAALTLRYDLDLGTDAIDSLRIVAPGETLNVGIFIDVTPSDSLSFFDFNVTYNPTFVDVTSFGLVTPQGFNPQGTVSDDGVGTVGAFSAGNIAGAIQPTALVQVGFLTLLAINETPANSPTNLLSFSGVSASGTLSTVTPSLTVTAIPEPSTFGFAFAVGALGLYRRKRRTV